MYPDPTLTLAGQMQRIVEVFYRTMPPEACHRQFGALSIALWQRVRTLTGRFCALYALWKAGRLPKLPVRTAAPPPPRPSPASAGDGTRGPGAKMRPAGVLPRGLRWMQTMLPQSAAVLAGGVDSLMRNFPEMQRFVAECPQVGRTLRPLARLSGLGVPDYLALPKRKRVRKKNRVALSAEDEAALAKMTARFPDTPPARSAKRALRRMFARLPVDVMKLSAVAAGYFYHPPRDGNCPPPEIGYGGRLFARLPKDYVRPKG